MYWRPALIALLASSFAPTFVLAQTVDPFQWARPNPQGQSVVNRPRPELNPLGIRVGGFRFYPSLSVSGQYEDNVFRSANNEKGDVSLVTSPRLHLESEWRNHALEVTADAAIHRYATESSEDREDFKWGVKGRVDVNRDASIAGAASLSRRHENRVSPDTGAADSPVQYNQASASITGNKRLGRFTMRGQGKVDRLDYANARQSGTFIPINHADRNRTIGSASLQAGYDYQEGSNIYLRIEGIASDYHDKADDAGFDRDSHGVDLRVGANVDLGGVTSGGAYVGYRGQYYEDGGPAQLNESEVEALILGANVTSNITKLTTIHGRVERGVFESTLVGSPGGISNRVEIGADHELLRNLLLNANFSSRFFDFEGVDRDDFGLLLQFGATYLVNRHLTLDGGFEHERNRSDGSRQGIDNTSNRIMIRLTTQP